MNAADPQTWGTLNDDLPALTEAGWMQLTSIMFGHHSKRVDFTSDRYYHDGDLVPVQVAKRLIASGYLAPYAPGASAFYHTKQADLLKCPLCKGQGTFWRAQDDDAPEVCPRCNGRKTIRPGNAFEAPYRATVKKPRSQKAKVAESVSNLSRSLTYLLNREDDTPEPSLWAPRRPGLYWVAINDYYDFVPPEPVLVRLVIEDDYYHATLMNGSGATFSWSPQQLAEEENTYLLQTPTVVAFMPSSRRDRIAVRWLSELLPPAMPKEKLPCG